MTTPTLQGGTPGSLLDEHIEPFLKHLCAAGYAERTLRKKRTVAEAFARWARRKQIVGNDLNDGHIAAFASRSPRNRKAHVKFELAVMRLLFEYLRDYAGLQRPPSQDCASAADTLLQDYKNHLRKDRGLTENSVRVYAPFIRDFLASQTTQTGRVSPDLFDTLIVRDFILEHTVDRSQEYARLLCTALRSFFRFLLLCGQISRDLSNAVPMFRKYRQSVPPTFLSPSEVEQVLAATGSTLSGRRDHAILLLLARLGLRGGEVVALELDDIRWRAGEIVVRGKGRMVDHLPLLSDVGEALAEYIRKDRGVSASRRVFLRTWAPRNGLTGPAAVGHIVRRALVQAGVRRAGRGAAHLFRHGLATKMIRHGASMSEIAEVLRHRSQTTTAIYAQVSFEALRAVALPWPAAGGAR
jgi:integrase/recombinase XerD